MAGMWVFVSSPGSGGACRLARPYATTVRVMENMLRLEAAMGRSARPAEAAIFHALGLASSSAKGDALYAYEELLSCDDAVLSSVERRSLRARVGVLYGEIGRLRDAAKFVAPLPRHAAQGAVARAVAAAYGLGAAPPLGPTDLEALGTMGPGWTTDVLGVRVARGMAEPDPSRLLRRRSILRRRGLERLSRLRLLAFIHLLLIVPGLAFIAAWLLGKRVRPRMGSGRIPAPWSTELAVAVGVRGAALGVLAFVLVAGALSASGLVAPDSPTMALGWATPVLLLPVVMLCSRRLFAPHVDSSDPLLEGLGVNPPDRSLPSMLVNSLMPMSVVLLGGVAVRRVLWLTGLEAHFVDVVVEPLIWGGPVGTALVTLEVVAWAPLLEEVIFRGVVYATARRHLAPSVAVPVTALLFGALHLYSLGGFIEVVFTGVVFAVAYERTRSLAPAIAAHAVGNAVAVLGGLLLFA